MSRRIRMALCALGLLGTLACGGERVAPPARLEGTFDLVLVGDLVFVTSTAGAELRVLDIVPEEGRSRDYVRAPNPLQALSIPLSIRSPLELVTDVRFESDGRLLGGKYVFARGAGREISVVGAEASILRQLGVLEAEGAITAFAAVRAETSKLFYAVELAGESRLYSVILPEPAAMNNEVLNAVREPLFTLPRESIVGLVVLPNEELAVATRALSGLSGQTLLVSTDKERTNTLADRQVRPLAFPAPVRAIFTHPRFTSSASGEVDAGARVYGLLEEEACEAGLRCSGLFGVDVATGEPLRLAGDAAIGAFPLGFGDALPLDVAFATGVALIEPFEAPLLGIVPASDGHLYFVDLDRMLHLDTKPEPATSAVSANRAGLPEEAGLFLPGSMIPGISVSEAIRQETISFVFQGAIPGLLDLPVTGVDGTVLPIPPSRAGQVQIGDSVELDGCPTASATVTAVTGLPASSSGYAERLEVAEVIDPTCSRFRVVAGEGSEDPWVVSGTSAGFLGRTRAEVPFSPVFPGSGRAILQTTLKLAGASVERGLAFTANIEANFVPFSFNPESRSFSAFTFPAAAVFAPEVGLVYTAYPSANGILEFPPSRIVPASDNGGVLGSYR